MIRVLNKAAKILPKLILSKFKYKIKLVLILCVNGGMYLVNQRPWYVLRI